MQMEHLKLEDMDSLSLDLEILQQEKQVTDQEITTLRMQLSKLQGQHNDLKMEASASQEDQARAVRDLKAQLSDHEKNYRRMQEQHDEAYNSLQLTHQQRLHELRSHFETEIIPDINQNHQRRLASLNLELSSAKADISQQAKQLQAAREESSAVQQKLIQQETEHTIQLRRVQ